VDSLRQAMLGVGPAVAPVASLLGLLVGLFAWAASNPLPPKGRCGKCDYDLTGNVTGRCPECGTVVDVACVAGGKYRVPRRIAVALLFAALATFSFLAAYSFWVEAHFRFAVPSSYMRMYLPLAACVVYLAALARIFRYDLNRSAWTPFSLTCLALGLALNVCGVFSAPLCR
jgi:hypothetical protein